MTKLKLIALLAIVALSIFMIGFATGFCAGRKVVVTEKVEYKKGETVSGEVTIIPRPEMPSVGNLRVPGLVFLPVVEKGATEYIIDTVETYRQGIEDWNKERTYNPRLFDNTNGTLDLSLSVQYNELKNLSYSFTPMVKEIIREKKRTFTPFVLASYNTSGSFGAGGGMFYHNAGLFGKYDFQHKGLEIGLCWKF